MTALDLASLKAYVSGGQSRSVGPSTVLLDVTHSNIKQRFLEIPFDTNMTIRQVKDKIYTLCGSSIDHMTVLLNNSRPLDDDAATLTQYGVRAGADINQFLHVIDNDPFALSRQGGLDDVSQVNKYVMSEEDYDKRENTYRAYKRSQLAADPNWKSVFQQRAAAAKQQHTGQQETLEQVVARCSVGQRCEVSPGARRGVLRYIGAIPELSGNAVIDVENHPVPVWIGVELDEPVGKHNGIIHGKRYFQTANNSACFVRPSQVQCGDQFKERDPFDEEEDESEAEKEKEKENALTIQEDEDIMQEL